LDPQTIQFKLWEGTHLPCPGWVRGVIKR